MTDATPEQLVAQMRKCVAQVQQYVTSINELIEQYERGLAPPSPPRLTVINGTDRRDHS